MFLNLKIKIKNISEMTIEEITNNVLVIFMVATYGEGGPTDDCIEFNAFLDKNKTGLLNNIEIQNKLHYAVFGLGSSKYEHFNSMGKKFDSFLEKSGAKR